MQGIKKRAAKSDSLISRSRNNHPEEVVPVEGSFAAGMSVHWAKFYADLTECQEGGEKSLEAESIISFERGGDKSRARPMRMI